MSAKSDEVTRLLVAAGLKPDLAMQLASAIERRRRRALYLAIAALVLAAIPLVLGFLTLFAPPVRH